MDAEPHDDLNDGHHFEALDRTGVALRYLEMSLGGHPLLRERPELAAHLDAAVEHLAELYQEIGRLPRTWS